MKCDKCGFEHQSKGVCPKCGANVVYVNEEYLLRRKQWEEGKTPTLGASGVQQNKVTEKKEGRPIKAGLSFAVIKDWLRGIYDKAVHGIAKLWLKIRRKKPEQPAPRPERERNKGVQVTKRFDPSVLFIPGLCVVAVAVIAAVAVAIVKHIDRSQVIVLDGQKAYYLADESKALMGTQNSKLTYVYGQNSNVLAVDESNVYIYRSGKNYSVDAKNPRVIAYDDNLHSVLYSDATGYYVWCNGKINAINTKLNGDLIIFGNIDAGNWALCMCTMGKDYDYSTYYLYAGGADGNGVLISESTNEPNVYFVGASHMIYMEMSIADFGIVNTRNLMCYDGVQNLTLVENADIAQSYEQYAYCLDKDGRLWAIDLKNYSVTQVDNEIEEVVWVDGGAMYRNEKGWSLCTGASGQAVCDASTSISKFVLEKDGKNLYCVSRNILYKIVAEQLEQVCELSDSDRIVYVESMKQYMAISDSGELYALGNTPRKLAENATGVMSVEHYDGYAVLSMGKLELKNRKNKTIIETQADNSLKKVAYSRKNLYFVGEDNILHRASKKKASENIGYCEYMAISG